jgi:hypothetical protein
VPPNPEYASRMSWGRAGAALISRGRNME